MCWLTKTSFYWKYLTWFCQTLFLADFQCAHVWRCRSVCFKKSFDTMFPRLTKLGLCHSLFGDPPKESFFFYYHIGFEMWWKTLKNVKLSENAYLIKCGAIHAQKMSHNGLWAIAHVSNGTNSQDDERTDLIFNLKSL